MLDECFIISRAHSDIYDISLFIARFFVVTAGEFWNFFYLQATTFAFCFGLRDKLRMQHCVNVSGYWRSSFIFGLFGSTPARDLFQGPPAALGHPPHEPYHPVSIPPSAALRPGSRGMFGAWVQSYRGASVKTRLL